MDIHTLQEQVRNLREALEYEARNMACICKLSGYIGEEPPCRTCQIRALLAGL